MLLFSVCTSPLFLANRVGAEKTSNQRVVLTGFDAQAANENIGFNRMEGYSGFFRRSRIGHGAQLGDAGSVGPGACDWGGDRRGSEGMVGAEYQTIPPLSVMSEADQGDRAIIVVLAHGMSEKEQKDTVVRMQISRDSNVAYVRYEGCIPWHRQWYRKMQTPIFHFSTFC